jgi:HEAT repeat protein
MTRAERLRAPDPEICRAAIAELAERGRATPEELAALADCLGAGQKAVERPAAEAFAALAARGVAVHDVLMRALASPLPRRRWGAAFALALLADDPPAATLAVLLDTLGADDGDLRWAAADIVVRLRDRVMLVESLRALAGSGNAAQRKMALYCLRDLDARTPEVEQAVLCALGDDDRDVRLAAVAALARLAGDRGAAAERLVHALERGDERLRRAAAAALGTLGERSAPVVAALRAAAASPDPSLRRAAEGALRRLRG